MAIQAIKDAYTSFFSDLNSVTKERPLVTVTYAFALTIVSSLIAPFSLILAIGVFSISLPFHFIIIINFKSIYQSLEEKAKDIFKGDPREKGQILGRGLKICVHQVFGRTVGFFEGIFYKNKEEDIL